MAPLVIADWLATDALVVSIDCLLPTGIIVPLELERDATFDEIKTKLWKEAQGFPLFTHLGDMNKYVFMCVTCSAEKMELLDETRCLEDVQPFEKFLKIVEKPSNKEEKIVNAHISYLIGKGLHEFDAMSQTEVSDFRRKMKQYCSYIGETRDAMPWEQRVRFQFPTDVSDESCFPEHILKRLPKSRQLEIHIIVEWEDEQQARYRFDVPCSNRPKDLVRMALDKCFGMNHRESVDSYVLKVSGREEYLISDHTLNQFMFIRRCITTETRPTVLLRRRADVLDIGAPSLPPRGPRMTPRFSKAMSDARSPMRKSAPGRCLWDMNETFSFTIDTMSNYNFEQHFKYQIRCCIYHGPEPICSVINSDPKEPKDGLISFDEKMTFKDLDLVNIPRMARLCFMFSATVDKRNKGKAVPGGKKIKEGGQEMIPMGWVNIPVFDYKGLLRSGKCTLYMWNVTADEVFSEENLLNPIGTVESNPLVKSSICLTLTFHSFNICGPIYFPPFDRAEEIALKHLRDYIESLEEDVYVDDEYDSDTHSPYRSVLEVAAKNTKFTKVKDDIDMADMLKHFSNIMLDEDKNVHKKHFEHLENILKQDALTPMHDQDKERVWMLRYEIWSHYPWALNKLLVSLDWANHVDVAQMQALLQCWRDLDTVSALELLDFAYADKNVRQFAIKCLNGISDSELQMYLLQLVQVLKYESYLECELVKFLLERALNNQHIGHNLFWLLRSEMHVEASVAVRFGLILEAFCRGTVAHMRPLVKQVEALDGLFRLNQIAKKSTQKVDKLNEDVKKYLKEKLCSAFEFLQNPLDPGLKIDKILSDNLKVMDSKMKPMWLEFGNTDKSGNPILFMYKKGDDLRQDMLTLQILNILDKLWQKGGYDLRMTAYQCLTTGPKEGLIEIVTEAKTITKIQQLYSGSGFSAFNRHALYKYLQEYNPTPESLDKAMEEFMYSCAGYSVATYVLGVGDRHGDNIMLKKNGQLCHIDFGHIMGNFKKKFGVNREPAPFQLTADFVYLLTQGPANNKDSFEKFKKLCEDAYMTLRDDRKRLITLFLMMVNTGIPELPSVSAIAKHLHSTLVPDKSNEDARKHFQERIKTAMKKATMVAFHGQLHNFRH